MQRECIRKNQHSLHQTEYFSNISNIKMQFDFFLAYKLSQFRVVS